MGIIQFILRKLHIFAPNSNIKNLINIENNHDIEKELDVIKRKQCDEAKDDDLWRGNMGFKHNFFTH